MTALGGLSRRSWSKVYTEEAHTRIYRPDVYTLCAHYTRPLLLLYTLHMYSVHIPVVPSYEEKDVRPIDLGHEFSFIFLTCNCCSV